MRRRILFFASLIILPVVFFAAETPIPDPPSRWVTDMVGFLPVAAAEQLNARLQTYEQQTGHQLLVWIGSTTGDAPIEDWAVRAFERWKVGRKGIDDGLVLFIMAQDRKLRIEVGYGLEGDVPDAIAFRVIDETITPGIRAGDTGGAVTAGMEQLAQAIGMPLPGAAAAQSRPARGTQRQPLTLLQLILYGIVGLIVLVVFATNPSLVIWLLANVLAGGGGRSRGGWGGGGGGSWGGGGGFGGGGGRSGGGGASGSW